MFIRLVYRVENTSGVKMFMFQAPGILLYIYHFGKLFSFTQTSALFLFNIVPEVFLNKEDKFITFQKMFNRSIIGRKCFIILYVGDTVISFQTGKSFCLNVCVTRELSHRTDKLPLNDKRSTEHTI